MRIEAEQLEKWGLGDKQPTTHSDYDDTGNLTASGGLIRGAA